MNLENANTALECFSDKFLIVGYKSNGRRGLPIVYDWVIHTAIDDDGVCNKTKSLTKFKVFRISEETSSFTEWINLRIKKSEEQTEKEEKELLEQLKAKYEPK